MFDNPAFSAMLQDLLSLLATVLVTALMLALKPLIQKVIDWLEIKMGKEQYDAVMITAMGIVRYLEQSPAFQNFDSESKKNWLMTKLAAFCAEKKIPMTQAKLDEVAEAAVRIVKKEIGAVDYGSIDDDIDDLLGVEV